MFTPSAPSLSIVGASSPTRMIRSSAFTVGCAVAVLLLFRPMNPKPDSTSVDHASRQAFALTSELHLPMGRSTLDGYVTSDGHRHRISIYWIEPAPLREGTHFLRYADILLAPDVAYYLLEDAVQIQSVQLSDMGSDALLPRDSSVESMLRSALATVQRIRCSQEDVPLEVGRFFQKSRAMSRFTHEVGADRAGSKRRKTRARSDVQLLNALPYGRLYSKETRNDGAVVWRVRKAMGDQVLCTITVTPLPEVEAVAWRDAFDPNTLGRWMLVPGPYRAYWSFDNRYSALSRSENDYARAGVLCDDIRSFLGTSTPPARVCRAMDRLRFKTSLLTRDPDRVRRSVEDAAEGLCQDKSVGLYRGLLELGEMAAQIDKHYPQQAKLWMRPLIGAMLEHGGHDLDRSIRRLMAFVRRNRWFPYGRLLLEEMRRMHALDGKSLDELTASLEASFLAARNVPPDPTEAAPTVRRYLAQLDAEPPKGDIDFNDIRYVLEEGLAEQYTDAQPHDKHTIVERTLDLIRLIVGNGPFRGDQDALIKSTRRFANIYVEVRKIATPIDTALATLLALSFCDTSSPTEHERLREQYRALAANLQSQVNVLLEEHELCKLVGPQDVAEAFAQQEHMFQTYVADPLWPPFKFPLTPNEQTRLANKLRLRLDRMGPLLNEMSAKVKYGGVSPELKRRTIYEISCIAEQLMVDAAFLRRPSYPGVSTQYRGSHGFTAVVDPQLYDGADRPKELFRVVTYFHLGHRLDEIVERERNRARPPCRDTPLEVRTSRYTPCRLRPTAHGLPQSAHEKSPARE